MKKILLTLALMVGVLGVTYAEKPEKAERNSKGKKEQAPEINKKEVLKTAAESLTTEVLERMKIELNAGEQSGKSRIYDCFPKKSSQFFYKVVDEGKSTFEPVYGDLVKLMGNTFDPETRTTNVIASKDKNNEDSEDKFAVTTSFDVKTTTAKGLAKYNVTISWKECGVKNGNAKLKSPVVVAKPIAYTGNEKSKMQESAEKLVLDALANPKFVSEDDLDITLKEGCKIENNPNSLSAELDVKTISTNEYVITPKDNVIITLDPKQYIKGEEYLYDDPSKLSYTITFVPVYTIVVSNYGEPAVIKNIQYTDVKVNTPVDKETKRKIFNEANSVRENYLKTLNAYLTTKDKAARKELNNELLNMFENEKTIVKVTYLPKNGKERVNDIEAKKYLQRIKGESFSFSEPPIIELNGNDANFTFEQTFKSKYYNDKVTKKITIGEGETGAYVIKGIEVVENSTERIEETK